MARAVAESRPPLTRHTAFFFTGDMGRFHAGDTLFRRRWESGSAARYRFARAFCNAAGGKSQLRAKIEITCGRRLHGANMAGFAPIVPHAGRMDDFWRAACVNRPVRSPRKTRSQPVYITPFYQLHQHQPREESLVQSSRTTSQQRQILLPSRLRTVASDSCASAARGNDIRYSGWSCRKRMRLDSAGSASGS